MPEPNNPPVTASSKVEELWAAMQEITRLEAKLALVKAKKERLETVELPTLFLQEDTRDKTLLNGTKAKLQKVVSGTLPDKDKRPEDRKFAVEWLEECGYGPNIKVVITAEFDRTDHEKAMQLYERLRGDNEINAAVDIAFDVHWKTYCKLVHEEVKKGTEVPLDRLNVTIMDRVQIKTRRRPNEATDANPNEE